MPPSSNSRRCSPGPLTRSYRAARSPSALNPRAELRPSLTDRRRRPESRLQNRLAALTRLGALAETKAFDDGVDGALARQIGENSDLVVLRRPGEAMGPGGNAPQFLDRRIRKASLIRE